MGHIKNVGVVDIGADCHISGITPVNHSDLFVYFCNRECGIRTVPHLIDISTGAISGSG